MRILICDDDAAFAQSLSQQVQQQLAALRRQPQICCVQDALQLTDDMLATCDLALLDIDMGEVSGMDVARRIRQLRPDCLLIFITNFVEYSLEGYEVQAFRYLLKSEVEKKLNTYLAQAISVFDKTHDCIRLNCEGDETDIPLSSLLYAETELRYLRLHVNAGPRDTLRTRMTMSELDSKLQSRGFLRVHKSFLVNMEYIQKLQSTAVYLPSGKTLPVSGHSYGKIKQEYLQWKGRARWAGD